MSDKNKEHINDPSFITFKSHLGLFTAKQILLQKAEAKLEIFEDCLNEVGLYKTFPFLDITHELPFIKKFISTQNIQIYPIDYTEEILMRNCVKRKLKAVNLIKSSTSSIKQ